MNVHERGTTGPGRIGLLFSFSVLLALALMGHAEPGAQRGGGASRAAIADIVNAKLGLRRSRLVPLGVDHHPDGSIAVVLPARAAPHHLGRLGFLDLQPCPVRSADYTVLVQQDDGSLKEIEPGPVKTFRGSVRGMPGTFVAAALRGEGLEARILFPDREELWLQPIAAHVEGASPDRHVVYCSADIIETKKHCALEAEPPAAGRSAARTAASATGRSAGQTPGGYTVAEIAIDVDAEYFRTYGSVTAVEERINSIINALNAQFEREVGIRHVITAILVRTAEPDPYTATDASALTRQFRDLWLDRHGDIRRDVAQLFTGKDLDGDGVGQAWLGGVRDPDAGYSVVQSDWTAIYASVIDLSAHELGHAWSAQHRRGRTPGYTMNRRISGANRFDPQVTIPAIEAFRDALAEAGEHDAGPPPTQAPTLASGPSRPVKMTWHDEGEGDDDIKGDEGDELDDHGEIELLSKGTGAPDLPAARVMLLPAGFTDEAMAYGVGRGAVKIDCTIYGGCDPEKDGVPNLDLIEARIERTVPDENYDGIILVDLESMFDELQSENEEERIWAEEQMLIAVRFVRSLRPRAKVSYWGQPWLPFKLFDDEGNIYHWSDAPEELKAEAIAIASWPQRLFAELDFLMPSAYCQYADPDSWMQTWHRAWVRARCKLAKEIADGREVALCICPISQLDWPEGGVVQTLLSLEVFRRDALDLAAEAGIGVCWWSWQEQWPLTYGQQVERIDLMLKLIVEDP